MAGKSCFVIMPIGDLQVAGETIAASQLRQRYDDLIKEALLAADPSLDVVRADDVAIPGTITSDILTRIMHSDLVVADVTYPNANVFYELGLRHACRVGTLIIRDKAGPKVPFDIAHLRHIEYENTPSGLKDLAAAFKTYLDHFKRNPKQPDNHFQELAKLTQYPFPDYGTGQDETDPETEAIMAVMQSPAVLDMIVRQAAGEEIDQSELVAAMIQNPEVTGLMTKALIKTGQLSFNPSTAGSGTPRIPPSTKKTTPAKRSPSSSKRKRRR